MSDTKESMPAQRPTEKPTVDLEKPPAWAISMAEKLEQVRRENNANHTLVLGEVRSVQERVGLLEQWRIDTEGRQEKHSHGVRQLSETDAKHDAAIGQLVSDVASVKATQAEHGKKLDELAATTLLVSGLLDRLTELGKTPTGQKIVGAVVTVLLLSLALLSAKLQTQVDAIEKKPPTVQPAPTVYLPAPADGGAL